MGAGEFNAIQVTLYTPWSTYEVFGFNNEHPVPAQNNRGAYQVIWNENEWPHPNVPTDDDSETSQYDPTSDEGDFSATPQMGYATASDMVQTHPSTDAEQSTVTDTDSEDPEQRLTYMMQHPGAENDPEYLESLCSAIMHYVYYVTVTLPEAIRLLFGILEQMMPIVMGMCEPK